MLRAAATLLSALLLCEIFSAADSSCASSAIVGQSISLQSGVDNGTATTFLRHAGFLGWNTPCQTPLDALDSTFVVRNALSGDVGGISLENVDEFPGYFWTNDATQGNRLVLVSNPEAKAASFFLRDVVDGSLGRCALESISMPGHFVAVLSAPVNIFATSASSTATPCHYAVCPEVSVVATSPNSSAALWHIAPPSQPVPAPSPTTAFTIGGLYFEVRNVSGTIATLRDSSDSSGFSFTPSETAGRRQVAGFHHLGDTTLRVRAYGTSTWVQATSAVVGEEGPVAPRVAPTLAHSVWASDLTPLLNATPAFGLAAPGLRVVREFTPASDGVGVVLSLVLSNAAAQAVEVGGLDVSLVTNNDWTGLSLQQNAATCSLADPYPGLDAGFVRVVRITGSGPLLLVTPSTLACSANASASVVPGFQQVACGGRLESWRMLTEDPTPRSITFEGFYAWGLLSQAWADREWAGVQPWNEPTGLVLRAGEAAVFSLRLSTVAGGVAGGVDAIDPALSALGLPVVQGAPGFVLTADMTQAHLRALPPVGYALTGIEADPPFSIDIGKPGAPGLGGFLTVPWAVAAGATGRARVTMRYAALQPGLAPAQLLQTVHCLLLPSLRAQARLFAAFSSQRAWFSNSSDAFARTSAFLHWDAHTATVTLQEQRAWVAGLSDESGAAAGLGMAAFASALPEEAFAPLAAAQLATYVNRTLLGSKADGRGDRVALVGADGGVRASMFWGPGMPGFDYTVSPCWDEPRSETTWRAYNYPHVVQTLLALYRLARDSTCLANRTQAIAAASGGALDPLDHWDVYLRAAAAVHAAMWTHCGPAAPYFLAQFGLMVGSGFEELLGALAEEARAAPGSEWGATYAKADAIQQARTAIWGNLTFPYGSEMPWDSTGQEEIFTFSQHYGAYATANLTLAAVKAYTPSCPHWGYHGSARRYFDFLVYGAPAMSDGLPEREFHHYGSGLNAVVLLRAYRLFPNDTYALRTGFAASWGAFAAIDVETGAPSMGFHADPGRLVWDSYSGDWGQNAWGALSMGGCYVDNRTEPGTLVGFGCDVTQHSNGTAEVVPRDALHKYVYLGPLGASLYLRTGSVARLTVDFAARTIAVLVDGTLEPSPATGQGHGAPPCDTVLRVVLAVPAHPNWAAVSHFTFMQPVAPPLVRGAYVFPWVQSFQLSWTPK